MWRPETAAAVSALADLGLTWPRDFYVRRGEVFHDWPLFLNRSNELMRAGFHVRAYFIRGITYREDPYFADAKWTGTGCLELTTEKPAHWAFMGAEW